MKKQIFWTFIYLAVFIETLLTIFFIGITTLLLTDPIDQGYFPPESYLLYGMQVITLIVQSVYYYNYFHDAKKLGQILGIGLFASLSLFVASVVTFLSVGFS